LESDWKEPNIKFIDLENVQMYNECKKEKVKTDMLSIPKGFFKGTGFPRYSL
jgi:hypothetical protein